MPTGALPKDRNGHVVQIPFMPGQNCSVPFSGVSIMCTVLANGGSSQSRPIIDVTVTQNAFVVTGYSSVNANTSGMYLVANITRHIILPPTHNRVAVIGASSTPVGNMYITERL